MAGIKLALQSYYFMVATDLGLRSLHAETCVNNTRSVWVNLLSLCTTSLTMWRVLRGDNDELLYTAVVLNGGHAVFRRGPRKLLSGPRKFHF
jgi:hypothetical protein